jgi:drug/metabolite transporter (DMT)-like permease
MPAWIAATLAAAFLQNLRFMAQRHLRRTVLSTAGATFARFLWGAPLAALFAAGLLGFRGDALPGTGGAFWGWALTGGLAQILATLCVVALFAGRNFAVGIALKKTETLQTALIAWLLLGEGVGPTALAAILVGFMGVLLLSDPPTPGVPAALRALLFGRSTLLGLGAGALFGVSASCYRGATLALDGGDALLRAAVTLAAVTAAQALGLGLWLLWREPGQLGAVLRAGRAVAAAGIAGIAGSLCWFTAFALQNPALVKAVGQVELLFSFAASALVFRETATRREVVGAVLIVFSVIGVVLAA